MSECMECHGSSCGDCADTESPIEEWNDSDYFSWLVNKIVVEPDTFIGYGGNKYSMLIRVLYGREFYSIIPNDDNRGTDGIALRETYLYKMSGGSQQGSSLLSKFEYKPDSKLFSVAARIEGIDLVPQGPCRLLEMLIALTGRFVFEIDDREHGDLYPVIFWELITNLGLHHYPDIITSSQWLEVHKKIDNFLDRKYKKNGVGGLFPLKNGLAVDKEGRKSIVGSRDQRTVELAYQMDAYLRERYRSETL